jgi:hypothetical protein
MHRRVIVQVCAAAAAAVVMTAAPARAATLSGVAVRTPKTEPTRVVVVFPPSTGPVDIVTNGVHPKTLAKHVASGTVTDYLPVPFGDGISIRTSSTKKIGTGGISTKPGQRETLVAGLDADGSFSSTSFLEAHGRLVESGGQDPTKVPARKAHIVGDGHGVADGVPTDGSGFTLGIDGGACIPTTDALEDPESDATSVVGDGTDVDYVADPGSLSLVWFANTTCTPEAVTSAPAQIDVDAGKTAYAFAWFKADKELHLLLVPINASGAGGKGVVDSGPGPTLVTSDQLDTAPAGDDDATDTTGDTTEDTIGP